MRATPKRSIVNKVAARTAQAQERIDRRTLWNQWKDPWEEINARLGPALEELGFSYVTQRDGSFHFATLSDRVLAALAELRNLRELREEAELCLMRARGGAQ